MKSLNTPILTPDDIFTEEILKHINHEGFKPGNNDSYCFNDYEKLNEKVKTPNFTYKKNMFDIHSVDITVYIFDIGIGVDVDYDCGGNLNNVFFPFTNYSFEEAYDKMVDYVNKYR
jgi:hypothetical protein